MSDPTQTINLSSDDVEQAPAETPSLSSSDVDYAPSASQGPVNPYATQSSLKDQGAAEGWMPGASERQQFDAARNALTERQDFVPNTSAAAVGKNIAIGASNFGGGTLTPILHPWDTLKSIAWDQLPPVKVYNAFKDAYAHYTGQPNATDQQAQQFQSHPLGTALNWAGQATTLGIAGEAIPGGGPYSAIKDAVAERMAPKPSVPAAPPEAPAGPSAGAGPSIGSRAPVMQPKPGMQLAPVNNTVTLELDPQQINSNLLDEVVRNSQEHADAARPAIQKADPENIAAAKDAVSQLGKSAAAKGDVQTAAAAAHAEITLDQILQETMARQPDAPPPSILQRGQAYLASVLSGVDPRIAAATLGMTPQDQEHAHVAALFIPQTIAKAADASAPPKPPAPQPAPVAPPSPAAAQANQQVNDLAATAARAAQTQKTAAETVGAVPKPPPPPKVPLPVGMEQGALTQDTVNNAGRIIQSLSPAARPPAVLESINNLTSWITDKGTIVGPDGKVQAMTGQSPASQHQSAHVLAVKIINDEMDRQAEQAQAAQEAAEEQAKAVQKQREDVAKQAEKNAEIAQQEREAALGTGEGDEKSEEPAVEIPNNLQVQKARAALRATQPGLTGEQLDHVVRNTAMVTTPVRKALVQEEIRRRAHAEEEQTESAMTGKPVAPGQDRESLQRWADAVSRGEHPYVFIPQHSTFKPAGVEKLTRTSVKGAGAFSGTYYHPEDVNAADIRKAARDKKNPQGALDALTAKWKGEEKSVELTAADVEREQVSNHVEKQEIGQNPAEQNQRDMEEVAQEKKTEPKIGQSLKVVRPSGSRKALEDVALAGKSAIANARTGSPFEAELLNGSGRENPDMVYGEGAISKTAILGAGLYATDNLEFARYFGPNVRAVHVVLNNPLVIGSDAEWRTWTKQAGWEFPNPVRFNEAEASKQKAEIEAMRSMILGRGYDGVVVQVPERESEGKTMQKVFGESQVVDFNAVAPKIAASPAVSTGLGAVAEEAGTSINGVLSTPQDGKIIAQALKNDGIITDSDMNPATALLTTKARRSIGNAVLETLLGPALVTETPQFVKEKLSGSLGTIGIINSKDDEWNLKDAIQGGTKAFNAAYREQPTRDDNPIVTALMKALDGPADDLRASLQSYAIAAEAARDTDKLTVEPEQPWSAFNLAFGTELTKEQYDGALKTVNSDFSAPVSKIETPAKAEKTADQILPEKPLAKGDKVTYQTNKGKTRSGEVAWTDGKKVRITDNGSTVNKNVEEVKRVESPASPAAEKPMTLVEFLSTAIDIGTGPKDYNGLKQLVLIFDKKEPDQLRMKQAQEAYEAALVDRSAQIAKAMRGELAFNGLVKLYESQPNLGIRTSTSIQNQAYSTPAPLAFVVDRFAGVQHGGAIYEPTAGNGMLLLDAPPGARDRVTANELEQGRADNLKELGFHVERNDATTWTPAGRFDAVVANPPFGPLPGPIEVDGYKMVKLDHLIAAKALSVMKDDGKACIILGAVGRDEPGAVTNATRPFFNWLYSHYNVVTDFELEGDLYSRQGASWPVRVIAIAGRVRSAKVSPVPEDINRYKTWREVYEHASQYLGTDLEGQRRADDEPRGSQRAEAAEPAAVSPVPAGRNGGADLSQSQASAAGPGRGSRANSEPRPVEHTGRVPEPGLGSADITVRSDGDVARSNRLAEGEPAEKVVRRGAAKSDGHSANALADESNQYQGTYTPHSEKKDVAVMAPKALLAPMQDAMQRISEDVGDIDQWVADELGYPDVETMHDVLMGTQVDGIAAALHQIQQGKAVIISDQTGLGKGRQAAAIIRWAEMHGFLPVFMTANDQLFTDMQRDLHDIGSGETINPLLFNAEATITDPVTGKKIYGNNGSMRPVFERILETGEIPRGRNAVYLTYSQINTPNRQQLALQRLAPRSIFVLDESHNAAGSDSNTGQFLQEALASSKGVAFLSATWAKRPDNLALYASKTDLSIAITDKEKVTDAIVAGGAPLQAVMTNQLTQVGQHVRRERSFDGITIENLVDEARQKEHEEISDKVTGVLRAIVSADAAYHNIDFARVQKEMKKRGKSADSRVVVVNHMEFSSIVHNLVKQLLLALKADEAANQIIEAIKSDQKPIFALENTMGSFLDSYVLENNLKEGDALHNLDYSKISDRALARTRYYQETDEMGNKRRVEVPLEMLSPQVRKLYDDAQVLIDNLNVDLPVSPIDYIRNKVEKAGYKIAEITGRTLRIDYSGEVPKLATVPGTEKKDRVNTASQFNNGGLDALIVNQAGSTGISLHAGEKFRDQRQRLMIVGQPAGDVNIVMQMLGRINRTGQVKLPLYRMQAVALPAEQRPAINLAKKMKSLNANVSSNTRSATSIKAVDLMNKYGDQVIGQYLVDNPEMAKQLGLEVSANQNGTLEGIDNLSMKATGRSALLPVKEQKAFMDTVTEAYQNYIDFLDETGQNDLEPKTYDFDAREVHSQRIFQGSDPTSPFGQDAHYGEYSIKRQGKAFTPEEVQARIAETFGDEAMKKAPNVRDTEAARALAEHFEELYKPYAAGLTTEHAIERATLIRGLGRSILNDFRVGTGLRISVNGDEYNAIVTRIDGAKKPSGNPYAPSSLQFTMAVNGPLRQIKVPGSQIHIITIHNLGRNASVHDLFQDFVGDSRQKAKIITGNLLGAYGNFKKGVKGRIIAFTMEDKTVRQGILMPVKFDVNEDLDESYAMRTADGAKAYVESNRGAVLNGGEGEILVANDKMGGIELRTKVAKASGGRFYLDPRLRELVVGADFASSGGMMKATVKEGSELAALKLIMQKVALYPLPSEINRARELDDKAVTTTPKPTLGSKLKSLITEEGGFATVPPAAETAVRYVAQAVPATIEDLTKAAKLTGRTMKQVGREIVAAVYPRALADEETKDIMGRGVGHPALTLFKASQLMDGIGKMFKGIPEADQVEFVDRWQRGEEQPTQDLQKSQEIMQSIIEGQRLEENAAENLGRTGKERIELSDRPNYFPNRYLTPPNGEQPLTDEEQMLRLHSPSKRPLEGSKAFLKQQKYTLKKAVEEGAVPLGTPVDMLMRRLQEGAKFVAAKYVMHAFKEAGLVTFLRQGKKLPDGYARLDDKIAKVWRPIETAEGGIFYKQTGEWVGDENAMRLLNNYLSKDYVRGTETGRALAALKNATTEIRLAFSPFHWAYITVENWASGINIGLDKLYNQGLRNLNGQAALDGLADLGKAMVSPYTAVKVGGQMLAYAKNPDEFLETPEGKKFAESFPDYPHLQKLLFHGGLRWGMPGTYRLSLGEGFTKEIVAGHLGKATLKFFPWLSHTLMKPLFEHYIPRAKWNFAVQLLAAKLNQYSHAIANGDITEEQIAREVASATENRFGEFNFDNLYWNNTFKTLNQLAFRSVSWKAGTWLGAAKAVKETFTSQAFNDRMYELIGSGGSGGNGSGGSGGGFGRARDFTRKLPQLGINAGWILSMALVTTVIGSVMTKLASGKWPWEWAEIDYEKLRLPFLGAIAFESMHPRTGMVDEHGEPIRVSFPTGLKDYEHAALNPAGYIHGSLSDAAANAWDTLENRDAFGNYVYNPNDPMWKAFEQGAQYNLKGDFMPISMENYRDQFGAQDATSKLERATGLIGGSPKSLDRSHALNEALSKRPAHTPETPEQEEAYQLAKEHPTRHSIRLALKERNFDYLQRVVLQDLSYADAKEIFNDPKTTDAERKELAPIMRRKQEAMIRSARR